MIRERLRPLVDRCRAITGPSRLGVRTNQLTIRTRTWLGGRPGFAGSSPHLYPTAVVTTSPVATTLPTAITLVNELATDYAAHAAEYKPHQIIDSVHAVTAPAATDQATAITLANQLLTAWNAHVVDTTIHFNADTTVTAPPATDLASLLTLVNAIRTSAHYSHSAVSDSDLVLPMQYKIRQVSQKDIVDSGGRYEAGFVMVEHITPFDGVSVGYTVSQLKPPITSDASERIYLVTSNDPAGGHTGEYDLFELRSFRPFSFDLVLKRKTTTP